MDITTPKPFVFVIMPFDKQFDNLYKLGIKPACEGAGAYAERVDDQIFHENILERMYNQISKADVIVADMTGRNPNVFYEVGYAHALGKPVILLTSHPDDIPFDLLHYPHIFYDPDGISDLIPQLHKRVVFGINSPQIAAVRDDVDVYLYGTPLRSEDKWRFSAAGEYDFRVKIDLLNSSPNFKSVVLKVGFIVTKSIITVMPLESKNHKTLPSFVQPDGKLLFLQPDTIDILPGEWKALNYEFSPRRPLECEETFNIGIRLLRKEAPPIDFGFTAEIIDL